MRTPRSRRPFISGTGHFPRRDPGSPGQGTPFACTRGRRGALGLRGHRCRPESRSPPSRRPFRALGGNKVHLCQRLGACACETVHSRRPPVRGLRARLAVSGLQPPRGPVCAPEEGGAARGRAGPTFLRSRVRPEGRPDPRPLVPGRWPPPWPVDFAFRALVRAGSGRAGARNVGVRVRAPGLRVPAQPGRLGFPRRPSQRRARLPTGCGSPGGSRTPAAACHPGHGAARGEDYKSQQASRRERGGCRRGPAWRLRIAAARACWYHTPGRDGGEAEASEALKHLREPEGRRME